MPGQIASMKKLFPRFIHKSWGVWEGEILPGPLCEWYRIRVVYRLKQPPRAYVLKPALVPDADGNIPHTYRDRFGRLYPCLYLPRKHEWMDSMPIAETIVPWTALWLIYYEHWRATGDWLGGGEHPQVGRRGIRGGRRRRRRQERRSGSLADVSTSSPSLVTPNGLASS